MKLIKMILAITAAFLSCINAAPINSTVSDYHYCNETATSSSNPLHILYNDLDKTLDVLEDLCLSHDKIVSQRIKTVLCIIAQNHSLASSRF